MKVGIVTQPLWGNFGGILQNYALQKVLRDLGHDPITLDFHWGNSGLKWVKMFLRRLASIIVGRRTWSSGLTIPYAPNGRKNIEIIEFVNHYISHTYSFWNKYPTNIIKKYELEVLITGSDQVWRPMYNPDLKDMYLDFARKYNIKKIAYAASFGCSEKEYTKKNLEECRDAATRLDAVSVRESSGIILCKDYFGIKAEAVLDPTLLLTADDYIELSKETPKKNSSYLAAYVLDDRPIIKDILNRLGKYKGLPNILRVSENEKAMSPKDWIALFRDASFVVTDSFHGTVFSILFKKQFITLYNHARGGDRFFSILRLLGLTTRLIDSQHIDEIERISSQEIDWTKVYTILNDRREKSLSFLRENLY